MDSSGGLYDAAARLSQFRELRGRGALCSTVTETLATEAAEEFLRCFTERREYLADAIALLAEIATLDEPCLAEPGQRATFPILVERLSDSFDPRFCSLYDRAFAQMIEICRRLPGGAKLDAALRRFGLNNAADLLARKSRIRQHRSIPAAEREKVRKVVVLSRVTLGAEVAVTSIAIQKTKRSFPNAEVVILGSPKLHHLFGGDAQLRIREVLYRSDG